MNYTSNLATILLKHIQAGIVLIDADTKMVVDVNPAACILLGALRDQIVGTHCYSWFCSNGSNCPIPEIKNDETFIDIDNEETKVKRLDGSYVYLLRTAVSTFLNGRRHVIVTLVDITRQKETERSLADAKDKAQMYLDMAFNMFVSLDTEGKIRLINRKGCDVLGIEECILIGQDWFKFVPEEDRPKTKDLFYKLVNGEYDGNITTFENHVINSKGEKRLIAWKNRVIRDDQNSIVGTFSSGDDVTDQRAAEKKIEEVWDRVDAELSENLIELKAGTLKRGSTVSANKRFELIETLDNLVSIQRERF